VSWTRPPRATEPYIARPEVLKELEAVTLPDKQPYSVSDVINVWAIQKILNQVAKTELVLDGIFGEKTESQVKNYQKNRNLGADGVAGPKTQQRMIDGWLNQVHGLPLNLLDGQVLGESGGMFTAVNWSKPPGCDCFVIQQRLYPIEGTNVFGTQQLMTAASVREQLVNSSINLRNRYEIYLRRDGTQNSNVLDYIPTAEERAWRLAMLFHNYQTGADNYSKERDHHSSYWTTPQDWVTEVNNGKGYKFSDGAPVRTPFEWCQNYALGSPEHNHKGNVCALVEDWKPRA